MAELGRRPEDIEAVAFAHLHSDHIGWACHASPGGDQPVFTHAEYLVSEQEWDRRDLLEAQGMTEQVAALAPRVRTITDGREIFPGVRVRIAPGHTVGHAEYVITGGGRARHDRLRRPLRRRAVRPRPPGWGRPCVAPPERLFRRARREGLVRAWAVGCRRRPSTCRRPGR
ncbi:MBL fold metallo-hydrolase [Streptomyces sp. NPDC059999]|uniref:MBL fold metallo-hydrolase n=1 Tax=Streptomyces sp. NPDC059999 TaxID=3347030 RepID=UPI00368DEB78